jgi:hypothetical protein
MLIKLLFCMFRTNAQPCIAYLWIRWHSYYLRNVCRLLLTGEDSAYNRFCYSWEWKFTGANGILPLRYFSML